MKSADADEIKSVPAPDEVGFHPEGISPTEGGFIPSQADLAEKTSRKRGFFVVHPKGFEPSVFRFVAEHFIH